MTAWNRWNAALHALEAAREEFEAEGRAEHAEEAAFVRRLWQIAGERLERDLEKGHHPQDALIQALGGIDAYVDA